MKKENKMVWSSAWHWGSHPSGTSLLSRGSSSAAAYCTAARRYQTEPGIQPPKTSDRLSRQHQCDSKMCSHNATESSRTGVSQPAARMQDSWGLRKFPGV